MRRGLPLPQNKIGRLYAQPPSPVLMTEVLVLVQLTQQLLCHWKTAAAADTLGSNFHAGHSSPSRTAFRLHCQCHLHARQRDEQCCGDLVHPAGDAQRTVARLADGPANLASDAAVAL